MHDYGRNSIWYNGESQGELLASYRSGQGLY